MSSFLLDTNVLSELRKSRCDYSVEAWSKSVTRSDCFTSTIVFAEIRFGIEGVDEMEFKTELERWLRAELRPWFSGRILEVGEDVFLKWRQMLEIGRKRNMTFGQPDLFIAAQAEIYGMTVVTRNTKDFISVGVPVLNPWRFDPSAV